MFSPEQLRVAREMGIVDDDVLAEVLRRELSCQDSGHLRNVLRVLVMSHIAANERMRELANTVDHHT
jgi:Arc/MetJ family transcription regulator